MNYVAASKRIEQRYLQHLARELDKLLQDRFDGNQTRAAKAIGISQAHISHLLAAEGRGPGLNTLLLLRQFTGRSIDDLLGLPPIGEADIVQRFAMTLETERIRRDANQKLAEADAKLRAADSKLRAAERQKAKKHA